MRDGEKEEEEEALLRLHTSVIHRVSPLRRCNALYICRGNSTVIILIDCHIHTNAVRDAIWHSKNPSPQLRRRLSRKRNVAEVHQDGIQQRGQ